MAEKVVRVDDFNGQLADRRRFLVIDQQAVQLDLTDKNDARLMRILDPYLERGTEVSAYKIIEGLRLDGAAVREWAAQHDIKVNPRGAISRAVQRLYDEAHGLAEPDESRGQGQGHGRHGSDD